MSVVSRKLMLYVATGAASVALVAAPGVTGANATETTGSAAAAVTHTMPFDCGQKWVAKTWKGHNPALAVDFQRSVAKGKNARASAAGTVVKKDDLGKRSYGRYLEIKHADGSRTLYAHLKSFAKDVNKGTKLKAGQIIGQVGDSGNVSGPHLHYEQKTASGSLKKVVVQGVKVKYLGGITITSKTACKK